MLDRNPGTRARGHRGLGFLAMLRGRPGEAAAQFGEAVRIDHAIGDDVSSEPRTRLLLASALDDSRQGVAAAAERDTALRLALARPAGSAMLVHLGRALARSGRVDATRVVRDSARARAHATSDADRATVLQLDAELAVASGHAANAERLVAAALRLDSTSVTLEASAWSAWRRGDLAAAASRYAALGARPEFGWEGAEGTSRAPYLPGLVEIARDDGAAARRAWKTFIARYPEPGSAGVSIDDARRRLAPR